MKRQLRRERVLRNILPPRTLTGVSQGEPLVCVVVGPWDSERPRKFNLHFEDTFTPGMTFKVGSVGKDFTKKLQ